MERVGTLINRLKEQLDQQEPADQLMVTAQLLVAELQPRVQAAPKSKVSVVMPAGMAPVQPAPELFVAVQPGPEPIPAPTPTPVVTAISPLFDLAGEIPTLAHQDFDIVAAPSASREINNVLGGEMESVNERFREERQEVAAVLQGAPIRDLKKGIGVNDRFLFVQDLFRGDENMYERSLKTINAFTIYPEAEYWIQRELKVKLSWPDNSETVQLFDQLVKRRFS